MDSASCLQQFLRIIHLLLNALINGKPHLPRYEHRWGFETYIIQLHHIEGNLNVKSPVYKCSDQHMAV